jgi:hypothetical protein
MFGLPDNPNKVLKKVFFFFSAVLFFNISAYSQKQDTINIYFNANQYELTAYHRVELKALLDRFSEVFYISIAGYADKSGSKKYNLELSRKRAVSVKNYLFTIGLDTLIRNFNYYGDSKAMLEINRTPNLKATGSDILSDRRVEAVVGGKPLNENSNVPIPIINVTPSEKPLSDNIGEPKDISMPPVIKKIINAKLRNQIILSYNEGEFSKYLEGKISQGDESLVKVIESSKQIQDNYMTTATDDGTVLSSIGIICFDDIMFGNEKPDSSIKIKVPVKDSLNCPATNIKLYSSLNAGGPMKWEEMTDSFSLEDIDGKQYISFNKNTLSGCVNFAYRVAPPCFNSAVSNLKFENLTVIQIQATLANINCIYSPQKKEEGVYNVIKIADDPSSLLFDMVVKDNKNKIYNLRSFPLALCAFDPASNTYLLRKKDAKKYLHSL